MIVLYEEEMCLFGWCSTRIGCLALLILTSWDYFSGTSCDCVCLYVLTLTWPALGSLQDQNSHGAEGDREREIKKRLGLRSYTISTIPEGTQHASSLVASVWVTLSARPAPDLLDRTCG